MKKLLEVPFTYESTRECASPGCSIDGDGGYPEHAWDPRLLYGNPALA